ncbi:response regulator containing a CheY-like receiver domain and an HTH DNA-binding domain [Leptolyngbya sp. PCC 7375]|nr:response regulator containing a CheY-like receiver domain and an HTH DNA-binding domain [Leptolyngbya sp. PCC 7375]
MLFIRVPVENLLKEQIKSQNPLDLAEQEQIDIQDPVIEEALTKLTNGVLIITEGIKLLYANECACRLLRQINRDRQSPRAVPNEINYLCKSIAEVHRQFPGQHWIMKTKICINNSINFTVTARYMKIETLGKHCIVLEMRDHYQLIKNIAIEEANQYGLTERETEIWLLQRANYTYKQIASELFIAPNTVKKHMQNIHLKQKANADAYTHQLTKCG